MRFTQSANAVTCGDVLGPKSFPRNPVATPGKNAGARPHPAPHKYGPVPVGYTANVKFPSTQLAGDLDDREVGAQDELARPRTGRAGQWIGHQKTHGWGNS